MKSFRSFSFFFFFLLFYFTICSCLFIDGTNKDVEDAVVKFKEDGCQPTSKVCRIYGNVCTGFCLLTSVFQNRTEPNRTSFTSAMYVGRNNHPKATIVSQGSFAVF